MRGLAGTVFLGVCGAWLIGPAVAAQVGGQGTGLQPTGVVCRNLTTGQKLISTSGASAWDCGSLGLEFDAGDRVETGLRGVVPSSEAGAGFNLRASSLPEDFAVRFVAESNGGILPGDLDSDGDVDLLGQAPFRWYENLGGSDPSFVVHPLDHLLPHGIHISGGEILDVDGDGRLDIVGSHILGGAFNQLSWFRNRGGSPLNFSQEVIIREQDWTVFSGRGADIDGDGDMDFFASRSQIVGCVFCPVEIVWAEDAGESYVLHPITTQTQGNLLAVDVDSDGDPDVVVETKDFNDLLIWYENEGGTFSQDHIIATQMPVQVLNSADVDADGDPDIVVAVDPIFRDPSASWYENLGDGSFVWHFLYEFEGFSSRRSITVVDASGDGLPDIFLGDDEPVWLENQGGSPPSFMVHDLQVGDVAGMDISPEAADMDQDGRLDLVSRAFTISANDWIVAWIKNQIGRRLSVTGLGVRFFSCHNRTTGQRVRIQTTDTAIDCDNEGLTVSPGDEIEVTVRGEAN